MEYYNYEAPQIIKDLSSLNYHNKKDCIDFEAYGNFLSKEETAFMLNCWTGNKKYHGREFRVFGRKGSGCEYAIWIKKKNVDILEQPVVLIESEGQCYTVATNFSDFLWCLENGLSDGEVQTQSVIDYVNEHATTPKRTMKEIIEEANEKYDFKKYIWSKVT